MMGPAQHRMNAMKMNAVARPIPINAAARGDATVKLLNTCSRSPFALALEA